MNNKANEVDRMTDKQSQMLLEAIKIIAERAETKEEVKEAIERIQEKGKEKAQATD